MTLRQAKAIARPMGYSLTHAYNEYRAAPYMGTDAEREAAAIYSDDLDDILGSIAMDTGRAGMSTTSHTR